MICKQCGGLINPHTYTCESCGVSYEKPPIHVHEVVAEDPRFATISAKCEISDRLLNNCVDVKKVVDLAIKDITHQLAEAILPLTEFRFDRIGDPLNERKSIQGTVRVKRPEHSDYTAFGELFRRW